MHHNLQKNYEDKIGTAKLNIRSATVGTPITFRLTYQIGDLGIDESGGFKVLFRTASDCADLQLGNPNDFNFLKISSSNRQVVFSVDTKSKGLVGKVYERPWSRGISITISNQYLSKEDKVYLDFIDWRTQTFAEKKFIFKLVADPFATDRCIELPNSPYIELQPDSIKKLILISPSKVEVNRKSDLFIKAEDKWGNPATDFNEKVKLSVKDELKEKINFPKFTKLKSGRSVIQFTPKTKDVIQFKATYKNITTQSNLTLVREKIEQNIFWADLHGQSSETIGTNDVSSYFKFARDYAHLDVTSIQGNDFQISNEFWKEINKVTKKINKQNNFIAFPGYEWSGNTNRGGDRNVIYLNEGEKIFRSSHALLDDFSDIDHDATIASDLYPKLNPKNTIVIPHVGGRYGDLSIFNKDLEPVVEIHSAWGTFEWFYFDALKRGYQVGVVANSDDHTGRLGASYPAYAHFNSYGGLTGIITNKLNRKSVFKAIKQRHCFATTGARINIDYKISNHQGKKVIMGDSINAERKPIYLNVECFGTDSIERIEVYVYDKIIYQHTNKPKDNSNYFKILWSGSQIKGRARAFKWEGKLNFKSTNINSLEKINFYSKKNKIKQTDQEISWKGMTTGGVQGFIVKVDKLEGKAFLNINKKNITIPLDKISTKPTIQKMGGLDAKLSYYKTLKPNTSVSSKFSTKLNLSIKDKKPLPIFIKVTQRNGHMAWTSPIFVKN